MVNSLTILYSALVLLVLAAIFGTLLAVLGKKLAIKQDERIDKVKNKLSGANCGACGYAGCEAFAKALVAGKADLSLCNATSADNKKEIANILGVDADIVQTVPVVCCVGGNSAVDKYTYMGYGDCRSMELLGGGRKLCKWGCLGMGSCTDACPEHAIDVRDGGYAVIEHDKCIGCGKCVEACPKGIIKRVPITAKVYIACSNCVRGGKDVRAFCKNGCIGCGLCAKNCPQGAIEMVNNLPVINYDKCTGCKVCVAKCPSKCILELDLNK
ncbi:MAG: RnfABCDGE type electron transport complex subunit B [Clostridia bacterium]|nr:RnfABCDGE type electron transport complex subunit B [Clostridia bacterium]